MEAGLMKWEDQFVIKKVHQVGGSGKLKDVKPGTKMSLKQLTELMIIESDNTATEVLTEQVGLDAVTKRAKKFGMTKTVMWRRIWDFGAITQGKDNFTTARDLLTFFHKTYSCAEDNVLLPGFSRAGCKKMIDILKRQKNRKMIPRYLSPNIQIAHKTGELTGVAGDAGIVYINGNPVILCFLANDTDNLQAREGIARFTKMVIHYLQKGAK